jgi:protein involved in polysaccharide export with SLBB domain
MTQRRSGPSRVTLIGGLLVTLIGAPGATAAAQDTKPAGVNSSSSVSAPDMLRPGDAVRLRVWKEPDLSGDFTINEAGIVTLPKVGPLQATTESVDSLKSRVVKAYQRYLKQPSIEVMPLRRIRVAGAVRNPGLYTADPTMTIADVIALAGGATPQGRQDRVTLIRNGVASQSQLSPDAAAAQVLLRSGDQVFVPERRLIHRNPGVVIGAVSAAASVIWAVRRLRP